MRPITRRHIRLLSTLTAFLIGVSLSLVVNLSSEGGYIDVYGDKGNFLETTLKVTIVSDTTDTSQKEPLKHSDGLMDEDELSVFKTEMAKNGKRIIWFLTTTDFNIVQEAKLTSIGQALFPVRDSVVWVIIKFEGISNIEYAHKYISNSTSNHILKTVQRLGVRFVLLNSKYVLAAELGTDGKSYLQFGAAADYKVFALQTGLVWVLQNINKGVLLLAEEEFIFDFHLFSEVSKTKTVSVWPVGLYQEEDFIFSPLVNNDDEVFGHFSYHEVQRNTMKIVRGGFAIDIEYMKTLDKKKLWMLTYDDFNYSFENIDIPMSKIKPVADHCTKIYVWRCNFLRWPWPKNKSLMIKKKYHDTNIIPLLKNCYNYKFYDIMKSQKYRTKKNK